MTPQNPQSDQPTDQYPMARKYLGEVTPGGGPPQPSQPQAPEAGQQAEPQAGGLGGAFKTLYDFTSKRAGLGDIKAARDKAQHAKIYNRVLEDPTAPDEQVQAAEQALLKLYGKSKEVKESLGKASQIRRVLSGIAQAAIPRYQQFVQGPKIAERQHQQRMEEEAAQQASIAERERLAREAEAKARISEFGPQQAAIGARERETTAFQTSEDVRKSKLMYEESSREADQLGLAGDDKAAWIAKKYPMAQKPQVLKGIEREGLEGTWTRLTYPDGTTEWEKEGARTSGVPRVVGALSISDAKTRKGQGEKFLDESGNEIDPDSLPETAQLSRVIWGGKKFDIVTSQNQTHFSVGGRMYAVPSKEQVNLVKGAGVELGVSALPRTGTSTVAAVDPVSGQMVYNTMPTTSTPATPGIPGRPGPFPTPPPPRQAQAPGAQRGGSPPPTPGSVPGLRGLPLTQLNPMLQRLTPVREAYSQVFGDPSQPEFTPLSSYAELADDPSSREKLGSALRYTFDQLNTSEGTSGQGFWAWAHDVSGFSNELARARANVLQGALGKLNPRETEAYNATVDAISTAVGIRTLSRASAAQASVRRIESDIPVIGVNVYNTRAFYDKLVRLAEITYNGSVGIPAVMFKPGEREGLKALPSQMKKLRDAAPTSGARKVLGGPLKVGDLEDGFRYKGGDRAQKSSWEKVSGAGR